jgi:DNA-binding LacI/PurR family transcriptional regulator
MSQTSRATSLTRRKSSAVLAVPSAHSAASARRQGITRALAYHGRTTGLLAAEWTLRDKGKARSLEVLLRTSVAASAIFAEAF